MAGPECGQRVQQSLGPHVRTLPIRRRDSGRFRGGAESSPLFRTMSVPRVFAGHSTFDADHGDISWVTPEQLVKNALAARARRQCPGKGGGSIDGRRAERVPLVRDGRRERESEVSGAAPSGQTRLAGTACSGSRSHRGRAGITRGSGSGSALGQIRAQALEGRTCAQAGIRVPRPSRYLS
jgi:hypothetical protein